MEENKLKTYVRGLGLLLAILVIGIVSSIALFAIGAIVFILLSIVLILVAVIAIILAPYYYAKKHEVKSTNFKLKKIKKKEKL